MSRYVIVNNNGEYLCYFERHSEYKKVYYTGFGKDIRLAIKTNSFTDAEFMLKKSGGKIVCVEEKNI